MKKPIKTLVLLTKSIIIDIQTVHINFLTSSMRKNEKYFNYKLTPGPT